MSPSSAVEYSAGALSVSLVSAGVGGIFVVPPSVGWMSNPSPVDEAAPDIPDGALLPGSGHTIAIHSLLSLHTRGFRSVGAGSVARYGAIGPSDGLGRRRPRKRLERVRRPLLSRLPCGGVFFYLEVIVVVRSV